MNLLHLALVLANITGYELDVLSLPESEPRLVIVKRR